MSAETTNFAWTIPGPSQLTQRTSPVPRPGPNQALIRVGAVSLNFRDGAIFRHSPRYNTIAKPGLVPCGDAAGTVAAGGPGSVWAGREGAKVVLHPFTWLQGNDLDDFDSKVVRGGGEIDGFLQLYVVLDDAWILEAPKNLSVEESSTLAIGGLPAWNAVFEGPVKAGPGKTVIVQGTGGLSCLAIQLAAGAGATVIALSSSDEKLQIAKQLGATHLINYRNMPKWSAEVRRVTNGRGADNAIDIAGTIYESLLSLKQGGIVSVVGALADATDIPNLVMEVILSGKSIRGVLGGSAEMGKRMVKFIEEHNIHPFIAKVYEFDQALDAIHHQEKQETAGKIVIKI